MDNSKIFFSKSNFRYIEGLGVNARSYKHGVFRNKSRWRHETRWQTNKSVAMHARANSAIVQILVHRVMLAARSRYRAVWWIAILNVMLKLCSLCTMTSPDTSNTTTQFILYQNFKLSVKNNSITIYLLNLKPAWF